MVRHVVTLVDVKRFVGAFLGAAFVLTGCSLGTSAAPIESASDGVVAAAGDSGVEVVFTNAATSSDSELRVRASGAKDPEEVIAPGGSATIRQTEPGSESVPYVVKGPTTDAAASFEIGFANPTPGCPNATVGGWKRPLCNVGDTDTWTQGVEGAGTAVVEVTRLDNSDGLTRYAVSVKWTL